MHQLNPTEQKWFTLIQEARSSGLSDKVWCHQNNVPTSTFYYHIRKLRNKVIDLPASRSTIVPEAHEIVKLEVLDEGKLPAVSSYEEELTIAQNTPTPVVESGCPEATSMDSGFSARIHMKNVCVDISNSASEQIIRSVISALRQIC